MGKWPLFKHSFPHKKLSAFFVMSSIDSSNSSTSSNIQSDYNIPTDSIAASGKKKRKYAWPNKVIEKSNVEEVNQLADSFQSIKAMDKWKNKYTASLEKLKLEINRVSLTWYVRQPYLSHLIRKKEIERLELLEPQCLAAARKWLNEISVVKNSENYVLLSFGINNPAVLLKVGWESMKKRVIQEEKFETEEVGEARLYKKTLSSYWRIIESDFNAPSSSSSSNETKTKTTENKVLVHYLGALEKCVLLTKSVDKNSIPFCFLVKLIERILRFALKWSSRKSCLIEYPPRPSTITSHSKREAMRQISQFKYKNLWFLRDGLKEKDWNSPEAKDDDFRAFDPRSLSYCKMEAPRWVELDGLNCSRLIRKDLKRQADPRDDYSHLQFLTRLRKVCPFLISDRIFREWWIVLAPLTHNNIGTWDTISTEKNEFLQFSIDTYQGDETVVFSQTHKIGYRGEVEIKKDLKKTRDQYGWAETLAGWNQKFVKALSLNQFDQIIFVLKHYNWFIYQLYEDLAVDEKYVTSQEMFANSTTLGRLCACVEEASQQLSATKLKIPKGVVDLVSTYFSDLEGATDSDIEDLLLKC